MGIWDKFAKIPFKWKMLIGIQSIATMGLLIHRMTLVEANQTNEALEAQQSLMGVQTSPNDIITRKED